MALIDIVIPNYQYGRYLRQCVESIIAQGIEDVRILIIDNASTDNSVETAQDISARDRRIEIRARSRNLGALASFNEGIDWAESKYFLILCADDFLPEGAFARALPLLESNPEVVFAYGACVQYRENEGLPAIQTTQSVHWTIDKGEEFIRQSCQMSAYVMAPLVRTAVQKRAGHYRPSLPYNNDVEMLLRLARFGDVAFTPAVQAIQRLHQGNLSSAVWKDPVLNVMIGVDLFDAFFRHDGADMPQSAHLRRLARRSIAGAAYWRAMALLVRGQYRVAARLLVCALRLSPRLAVFPPIRHLTNNTSQPLRLIYSKLSESLGHQRKSSQ